MKYPFRYRFASIHPSDAPMVKRRGREVLRYRQELWIGFSNHAATFSSLPSTSSPLLNFAPALTNATR
jgi:hypothetical protein